MTGTWVFCRGAERMEVQRVDRGRGAALVVSDGRGVREQWFDDVADLIVTQVALERHFVTMGWVFVDYTADRPTTAIGPVAAPSAGRQWPRLTRPAVFNTVARRKSSHRFERSIG